MKKISATRRLRPGQWGVTAGVACIALGLLSFNAFATFTATVQADHTTTTGDMELTLGSAGVRHRIATGSTNLVPGDTVWRTIELVMDNTASTMNGATLTTSASGSPSFTSTAYASGGLGLFLSRCSVGWTEVGGAPPGSTYTCSGTTTNIIGTYNATPASATYTDFIKNATDISSGLDVTDNTVACDGTALAGCNYLLVGMRFNPSGTDSMESASTTLSFLFEGTQRSGSAH